MRSCRPALLVVLCLISSGLLPLRGRGAGQVNGAVLTNTDILEMLKAGLSQDVVLAKIKASACAFDTSPDVLVKLKGANVPNAVILAMVEATSASNASPAPLKESRSPNPVRPGPQVQPKKAYASCAFSDVAIYSSHSFGSSIIAKIPCGDALALFSEEGGFARVQTESGIVGYVSDVFVSETKPQSGPSTKTADLRTARIACKLVAEIPMFDSPRVSSKIGEPKCGEKISILEEQGSWDKVQTEDGKVGYVASLFVSKPDYAGSGGATPSTSRVQSRSFYSPVPTLSPSTLHALAWRAVPWTTTTYYQRSGSADTSCTGSGAWLGNIYQAETNCTTQYTPAQNIPVSWTHYTIYDLVETETSYLVIACTRNWAFSKCAYLIPGSDFLFEVKGRKFLVTGQRGGNGKEQTLAYDVVSSQSK